MKLRIVEEQPGELRQKADDVVRTIERLTGRSLLKAVDPEHQIKQTAAQFEYKALEESAKRHRKEVDRIRRLLDQKIQQVLEG